MPEESRFLHRPRTNLERQKDLIDIGRLYAEGKPLFAIARYISETRDYELSSGAVSRDIKILHEAGLKRLALPLLAQRQTECMKLDRVEQEAWEAWYRSLRERTRKRSAMEIEGEEEADEKNPRGRPRKITRMLQVEESWGDPRYLQIVQWCIDRRCKLLGLDAPPRGDTDTALRQMAQEVAELEGLDAKEVLAQAQEVFANTRGFN